MKFLAALLAILAVATANEFQLVNPLLAFPSDTSASEYFALKNIDSATANSVSFVVIPLDPHVLVAYSNGASSSFVGSIQNGATGYGNFQIIGSAGYYAANVNITYKKGFASAFSVESHLIFIDIYGDDDNEDNGVDGENDRKDTESANSLNSRTAAIYSSDSGTGFAVVVETPTWVTFHSHTGTSALNTVTFTVVPDSANVVITYASGSGNSLGSIAANTEKDTSFQISSSATGDCNLNVTYKYKIGSGSFQYLSYSMPLTTVAASTSGGGRRAIIANTNEAAIAEKQPIQYVYVAAAGAGVAVVAVVAAVGTVLYRRRSTETITA